MGVRFRDGGRMLELHFWWEEPEGRTRVLFRDRLAARTFVARLGAAGNGVALRRLVAGQLAAAHLDDHALFDQLSRWIASDRLRIARTPDALLLGPDHHPIEEASVAQVAPRPEVEEPEELVEEALPPRAVDAFIQAMALEAAALRGVPFCEECEKTREALRPDGVPLM